MYTVKEIVAEMAVHRMFPILGGAGLVKALTFEAGALLELVEVIDDQGHFRTLEQCVDRLMLSVYMDQCDGLRRTEEPYSLQWWLYQRFCYVQGLVPAECVARWLVHRMKHECRAPQHPSRRLQLVYEHARRAHR